MKQWILLLSLGLSACASDWLSRESTVEVSEVARSQQCNSEGQETRLSLLPDPGAVAAWQQQRGVDLGARLPQGPFVLVEMGERNSGGYGIAISRLAGRRGDTLTLRGTFIAPAADDIATQAITSPCVLVSLPREGYGAVEIVDQDGRLRGRASLVP